MKAAKSSIWDLYNGAKQYVVPLFQRPYVWSKEQWTQLWADILEQYQTRITSQSRYVTRFLGSIVLVREYEKNLDKFTIIDGQQRITTISILFAVIRAFAKERDNLDLYAQIEGFLNNFGKSGEHQYVVIPTRVDKHALYHIFDEDYAFDHDSKIIECFDFFWRALDKDETIDLHILQQVITEDLCVVYIELDEGENPNQVFEALNYRGVPLEESDLIRNFFFASFETSEIAEAQYDQFWKPMEERLTNDQILISQFLRHFCMRYGEPIRQGEIFEVIRRQYMDAPRDEIRLLLRDMNRFSNYYLNLLEPETYLGGGPLKNQIRKHLSHIKMLCFDAPAPFLMGCLAVNDGVRNQTKPLSDKDLSKILELIESYLVRRAVCSREHQGYEIVFAEVCKKCNLKEQEPNVELVRSVLTGMKNPYDMPEDDEFEDRLRSSDIFHPGGDNRVIWLILESLEDYFKEQSKHADRSLPTNLYEDEPTVLMIDHIMPEHFSPWWIEHLGNDWLSYQEYLHRLGNLTLTLENPTIKKADFETKRAWYSLDNQMLNSLMRSMRQWHRFQIEQRSSVLAAFCLKIWPINRSEVQDKEKISDLKEPNICMRAGDIPKNVKPVKVIIWDQPYPVRFWYQVLEVTVKEIYGRDRQKFERIIREYPGFFSEDSAKYRTTIGSYSYKSRFGRYQIRDMCLNMVRLVGWSDDTWCLNCE